MASERTPNHPARSRILPNVPTGTSAPTNAARPRSIQQPDRASASPSATARNLALTLIDALDRALSTNRSAIELAVMTLCAGGHLLLEDVPGVGKTTLARALAAAIKGTVNRIQFTSDMLPSDLTGVSVFDQQTRSFTFVKGPLFADIVLADEINRANPKTQAAMLEAMGERCVSVDGTSYALPDPYLVVATQNPVEMEGTYPLPEAQLDRFMTRISLGYPSADAETRMLMAPGGFDPVASVKPLCTTGDIRSVIACTAQIHVDPVVAAYAVRVLNATRSHPDIRLGASPRAGLALLAMSRARALLKGQTAVYPGDIRAMATPVLAHRIMFAQAAGGARPLELQQRLLEQVLATVPAPRKA